MKFDILDTQMRSFERSLDQVVPPEVYMVARLDGKGFTRLTKELCAFEAPFDTRFRDMMIHTVRELMNSGWKVIYAFTASDEISLLFDLGDMTFGRKVRKVNSTLAGVASASFSLQLGQLAVFDCRLVPLPDIDRVQDYFLWRQEDIHRNALNSHCYWAMRHAGMGAGAATDAIAGKTVEEKIALLSSHGIRFADLPPWQTAGLGFWWERVEKSTLHPKTGEPITVTRRAIREAWELPVKDAYGALLRRLCMENLPQV